MGQTIRTKVAVVGLGAAGAAALWALARAGVDAVGVERGQLAHALGSSHGQTRLLRVAYAEGARYVPLVRRAIGLWRELEAASRETIFHHTGVFYAGAGDSAFIATSLASARAHDVRVEAQAAPPHGLKLPGGVTSFLEVEGGFLESDRALAAFAGAATRMGARVLLDTAVTAVSAQGRQVEVATSGGAIVADTAIVTAGAWTGELLPALAPFLFAERKVLHWFADPNGRYTLNAGFKPFIADVGGGAALYGFPKLDGRGVKVAEHVFGAGGPHDDLADRSIRPGDIARIDELLRAHMPELGAPIESKVCLYPMSRDGDFMLDRLPGAPNLIVGAGLSGHGFKFSPALGEALAALALERAPPVDVSFLSLKRFG